MISYSEPPVAQPCWPLVGALPSTILNLPKFIQKNHATHGDIYTISIPGQKFVVLNHPRHVEHVKIRAKEIYHTGKGSPLISLLFPDGILANDGQRWQKRRAPLQPYFNPSHLKPKLLLINSSIQRSLTPLENVAETGENIDLKTVTAYLSMRVLIETIFGVEAQPAEMIQIKSALDFVVTKTVQFIAHGNMPSWIPMPGRQQSKLAIQTFHEIAEKLCVRQRELNTEEDSLFNTLQNVSLSEPTQESDRLISQILELLLAGYETTASTIFWVITFLVAHEESLQKVTHEIDNTLGMNFPSQEDLTKFPYLKMVISEILRLFPTAYLFWLRCMKDDEIDGYKISEGARVVFSAYHIHRHPEFWDDPEAFRPERFASNNGKKIAKSAFIPFGLGARKCLGNQFALMEIQLAIIRILQLYRLEFAPGYDIPEPNFGISLRPKKEVMLGVKRR